MNDIAQQMNENNELKIRLSEIKRLFEKREQEMLQDFDILSKELKHKTKEAKKARKIKSQDIAVLNPESLKLSNVSCDKETGKMSVRKLVQTSLLEAQVKQFILA